MRQFEKLSLNSIGQHNPELARELLKVDRFLGQLSHAVTPNAIASGQEPAAVTSSTTTNIEVKESGTSVSTSIGKVDFLAGFDVSESPAGEANISLDLSEITVDADTLDTIDSIEFIQRDGSVVYTGDQSMGSNSLTNTTTLEAPAATKLELVSNETDGASAEAFRLNWDANVSAPNASAKFLSIGYTDNADVFQEAASFSVNPASAFGTGLNLDRGTGTFRGIVGLGTTTALAFSSSAMRFRIASDNAFEVLTTTWHILPGSPGSQFGFKNSASGAGGDSIFAFFPNTTKTSGELITFENPVNTNVWEVDYAGAVIQAAGLTINSGNAFLVDDVGLVVGHTAQVDFGAVPELQVLGTGAPDSSMGFARFSADANGATLRFLKSRNATIGSNTIAQDGDELGRIRFQAADGTDFNTNAAEISVEVDGTPGANDMPGRILFSTTSDGASSVTERMRITSDGHLGVGLAAPTGQFHVDQSSATGAKPVVRLDQGDIDDTFIDFIGTSAADGSRSISSDTTEDSAKFGAVRCEINGITKWIRVYDDES